MSVACFACAIARVGWGWFCLVLICTGHVSTRQCPSISPRAGQVRSETPPCYSTCSRKAAAITSFSFLLLELLLNHDPALRIPPNMRAIIIAFACGSWGYLSYGITRTPDTDTEPSEFYRIVLALPRPHKSKRTSSKVYLRLSVLRDTAVSGH